MIALPELHNLIRSLNKPEKRFFKLLSATESFPVDKAIALFDHIEKISDTDDVYYKTEKESKIDVTSENLDLLYRLILKSQRNFYSDSITGFTLSDELTNLKILFEKAQYKQCRKMIKAAKEKSLQNEKFSYWLEILELEKQLLHTEVLGHEYPAHYAVLKEEKENVVAREKNVGTYYQLYSRLKFHIKSKNPKGRKNQESFYEKFLEDPYISNHERALSRRALFLLLKCRALCYNALRQHEQRLEQLIQLKELMQADSLIFDEMPRQYIDVLNNLASSYIELGEYLPAKKALSEIQSLVNSKKLMGVDLQIKARSYAYNIELALLLLTGKLTEAGELAQTIYEFIKENQKIFNKEDKSVLLYNLVNLYIYTANYPAASRILDIAKMDSDKNSRWDIKAYSRIQEMIVHYELKEFPKFVLAVNAAKSLLRDKLFSTETECRFIEFFVNIAAAGSFIAVGFDELHKEIKAYSDNSEDRWVNYFYFNFVAYSAYKSGRGKTGAFLIKNVSASELSHH
jgi:hypothetical protein